MKKYRTMEKKGRKGMGSIWARGAGIAMAALLAMQLAGCGAGQSQGEDGGNPTADRATESQGAEGAQGGTSLDNQGQKSLENTGKMSEYDEDDLDGSWNEAESVVITCDGSSAEVEGEGAKEEGGVIAIKEAGTYVLRGTYQGQVLVDAGKTDVVRLVMDGFHITCEETSPVYGLQSGKIVLILAEGTENSVTDGAQYAFSTADEDEPDGAVFSKDDLTINGTGTLTVKGNYSNGIRTKDHLKAMDGTLDIRAERDGLKGKDSVTVKDGQIRITSGEDGIKANNDSDPEKGYVVIEGGSIQIQAGDDGIHAETWLTIYDGDIEVQESYEGLEGLKVDILGGNIKVKSTDDGINGAGGASGGENQERAKMEVNEEAYVRIAGGTVYVDAMADGIDSNGHLYVEGGYTYISGPVSDGNGALDYNGEAYISGGVFAAAGSGGMMQTFSEDSEQNMIMVYYSENQEAGSRVVLTGETGDELLSYEPYKEFACILLSAPGLEQGKQYTLSTGSEVQEVTVEDVVTVVGERPAGIGMKGFGGVRGGPGGIREGRELPEQGEISGGGHMPGQVRASGGGNAPEGAEMPGDGTMPGPGDGNAPEGAETPGGGTMPGPGDGNAPEGAETPADGTMPGRGRRPGNGNAPEEAETPVDGTVPGSA